MTARAPQPGDTDASRLARIALEDAHQHVRRAAAAVTASAAIEPSHERRVRLTTLHAALADVMAATDGLRP